MKLPGGAWRTLQALTENDAEHTRFEFPLDRGTSAMDVKGLQVQVRVIIPDPSGIEVLWDGTVLEIERSPVIEELWRGISDVFAPDSEAVVSENGGTVIAAVRQDNVSFVDAAYDPGKRYRFHAHHDGLTVEAAEKGNERAGYRIEDERSGKWLSMGLAEALITLNLPAAEARYYDRYQDAESADAILRFIITPQFEAVYSSLKDRVKAEYILKERPVLLPQGVENVTALTFSLAHNFSVTAENGGAYWREDRGDLLFINEQGEEIFRIPEPRIWDASGKEVRGSLRFDDVQGSIALTVPRDFLETAHYPVTIDPTTIVTTASVSALFNSGGRKLVADRYGNLIALLGTAATTLTAYGSSDGGKTWPVSATVAANARLANGFSMDMDSASSVAHVVWQSSASVYIVSYGQIRISYNAQNQITAFTIPAAVDVMNAGVATEETAWSPVVIAARVSDPGSQWINASVTSVPVIFSYHNDVTNTNNSSIFYSRCKISNNRGIADCAASANNWTAVSDAGTDGNICNVTSARENTAPAERYSLAAAQTFPSGKVWLFAASEGTQIVENCNAAAASLMYVLGTFSSTSTWTFPVNANTNLKAIVATAGSSARFRHLTALSDNTFTGGAGTDKGRALVAYASGTANLSTYLFTDDNTVTSIKVVQAAGSEAGIVGEGQLALSGTSVDAVSATASRYFYYGMANAAAATNTTTLWSVSRVWGADSWTQIASIDNSTGNTDGMMNPYAVQTGKLDFIWLDTDPGTDEIDYSTWHLNETLFATSTVYAAALSVTSTNPSTVEFADENDYGSVTSSDDVRYAITTNGNSAFPIFTLRKVHPQKNVTQIVGVSWEGQSSNAATSVRMQIFKFKEPNPGWYTLAEGSPPGANTDFTISASATQLFPVSVSMADYYGPDPTQGISATSVVMVRVYQGAAAAETLRTDVLRVTFADVPPLAPVFKQDDFIFENDSASSVNENTNPVSASTSRVNVQKGERFGVRFLLTNAGSGGASTTIFQVQYDRNFDNVWRSVTSGEISIAYGISGTSVSQLTARKTAAACSGSSVFNNNGRWYENTASSGSYSLSDTACTELAWVFSTASATPGTTYRLRLHNWLSQIALSGYSATPTLTIINPAAKKFSKSGTAEGERFSLPATSDDLAYFLDATGYAAVAASDGVYDTATSFQTNGIPVSLFKIRNTNNDPTQAVTITWEGHSNVAPSANPVVMDIWNQSLGAWVTASTNNWLTSANTDFTFTSVTAGAAFYDVSNFISVRVRQVAGQEALRTDMVAASFADARPTLTQRAWILENDNGDAVTSNTQRGSGVAEKGERFAVRFQVDNTGTAATTTQYAVQYDRNGDNNWRSVTSGEIAVADGISGTDGATLTSQRAGACVAGVGFTNGEWHEQTALTSNYSLPWYGCTEFAWIFSTATATPGTAYRFRFYNQTAQRVLDGSVATPTLTIANPSTKKHSKTGAGLEIAAEPASSNDLGYYLDATGYQAILLSDDVYDTATSTAGNVPVSLFKFRNPNLNTTDQVTVTWEGESSAAPNGGFPVSLDIWHQGAQQWFTLAANSTEEANTDFTLAPSATSGAALYDAAYFIYVRVRQPAGVAGLRTDRMAASFAETAPVLTERAYRLENDDGNIPDTNSERSGVVEKGERFTVRFQIDNTGTMATTTQYEVQFDRNGDNNWRSVTSGELSAGWGIAGQDNDALTLANAGSCTPPVGFINGIYHENTATTNNVLIPASACTEHAFIITTATATLDVAYRLRLYNATAHKPLDGYSSLPSITIVNAQNRKHSKTGAGQEFSAPSSQSRDLPYYLDAAGYNAILADDGVYDTATSTAGNVPVSLFKRTNGNGNDTDQITISWTGQSTIAASTRSIALDIWHNGLGLWITASTNAFTAANTDFTFETATTGAAFYDAKYVSYVRVRQAAGAEALKTDRLSMVFGAPYVTLIQRGAIFENDNGSIPDTNTMTASGSPALAVEKGQRFTLRFQLDNSGNVATTSQFEVQFDHDDGIWKTVTSGEISVSFGISGSSDDALTINNVMSCAPGVTYYNGDWHENTAFASDVFLPPSRCTELAWVFSTATSLPGAIYNFRLYNDTANAPLHGSMATPTLTIVNPATRKFSKTGISEGERFSVPATPDDLVYFLDATGYAAVAASDGVYDTATSFQAGSVPVSLFKLKNTNLDASQVLTLSWTGHSNVDAAEKNISLDLWRNDTASWHTVSTNAFYAPNTDFTFTVATSSPSLYDSASYIYARIRQEAEVAALRTDRIAATFADPQVLLTQRAAIFENDDGDIPDTNTMTASGSPALAVEKGQRFTVRYQVDNTGNVPTTTKFHVQFDRNGDNDWRSVTSGELSSSFGVSGANGDALTSLKANGGACIGQDAWTNGAWHENTATSISRSLDPSTCTEVSFIFSTASATPGVSYRLRLVNGVNGNEPLASVATPTLTIADPSTKKHSKTGAGLEISAEPASVNDLGYYLDATGYQAMLLSDDVYDTATSTAGNVPVSLFKFRNPNLNDTDQVTVTWEGQSSAAPNGGFPVSLDLWHQGAQQWFTLAANSTEEANTDVTLAPSATSGAALYDAAYFIYVRVRQPAGVAGLRTDRMAAVFQETRAQVTQRAAVFENDNGAIPDANTLIASGSPALTVEKGQRVAVRFQVDNAGTVATSAKFHIEYDHADNIWKSVTSGELAVSLGMSGSNGDALSFIRANDGSCDGRMGLANGTWHENTATTNLFSLDTFQCAEFSFMLSTASATPDGVYRLRMVNGSNGNQPLYAVATPTLHIVAVQTTMFSKTGLGWEMADAPNTSDDLGYYLDATGYQAVLLSDEIYDTATSTAGNVPVSLFKFRNSRLNDTDEVTIHWTGHSNFTMQTRSVSLDIWNIALAQWVTASTNNFTAANTDFTFSVATSNNAFYDANSFAYVRVKQVAGTEALRTDRMAVTFAPPPTRMILFTEAADMPSGWTCVSCAANDLFFERFPMASSVFGLSGGTATHTHAITWQGSDQADAVVARNNAGGVSVAADLHTHDGISLSDVTATTTLPAHGNIRMMRYDAAGDPTAITTGTIAMFKSSTLPNGWSLVTRYDANVLRGESATTVGNGMDTHEHTASVTTTISSATAIVNTQTALAADPNHTHRGSALTDAKSQVPEYTEVVLAKVLSTTTVIPLGILTLWDGAPDPHWTVQSNDGGNFANRFLRPNQSTAYPTQGGVLTHQHTDQAIPVGQPSATISNARSQTLGTQDPYASDTHTHNITVSYNTVMNRPPYRTVLVAEKTREPSAVLTQRATAFENDDGATPDTNTMSANDASANLYAEKGQRFTVRFQVDAASGSTSVKFAVQFDRSDGAWNSVTSGEIAVQQGLAGSTGDAITIVKGNGGGEPGSCAPTMIFQNGMWQEETSSTILFRMERHTCTEFAFMLSTATAIPGTAYRLRLVNTGNASEPLYSYATPTIHMVVLSEKKFSKTGSGAEYADPPGENSDAAYWLDASSYAAVTLTDGVFDSATSSVANAEPHFVFRVRHTVNTHVPSIEWKGQVSDASSKVVLQAYQYRGSATGWMTFATTTPPSANTTFTATASVAGVGVREGDFFDSDPKIATTAAFIAVRVVASAATPPWTIRSDSIALTFTTSAPALAESALAVTEDARDGGLLQRTFDRSLIDDTGDGVRSFKFRADYPGFLAELSQKTVTATIGYRVADRASGRWAEMRLLSGTSVSASASGEQLTFTTENVFNGTHFAARDDGVKAAYRFTELPASNILTFQVLHNFYQTEENNNAPIAVEEGGDMAFRDPMGNEIFRLPQPVAIDAVGAESIASFGYDAVSDRLTITVPQGFLNTAAYPVDIDPTVIVSAVANATLHSGGRKLVVDRNGNLIAFARTAANTLTGFYSNDGGRSWINTGSLSTAINANGFGVAYDGATSTVHVAYVTGGGAVSYNQVNIGYTAVGDVSSLTYNNLAFATDNAVQATIIAASGTSAYVPLIAYERDTNAGTADSGIFYFKCNSAPVGPCRAATANWTARAGICDLQNGNTMSAGLSMAQFRPSKKIAVFWSTVAAGSVGGSPACAPGGANALNMAIATIDGSHNVAFGLPMFVDAAAIVSPRSRWISAAEDTAWSSTNSRILVTYARNNANPFEFSSMIFNDDGTNTSTRITVDTDASSGNNIAGQAQCAVDTAAAATTSKRFLCMLADDAGGTVNNTLRLAAIPIAYGGEAWRFVAVPDPATVNTYPMLKTTFPFAYDPYGAWLGYPSSSGILGVKPQNASGSSTVAMTRVKLDVVYAQGANLASHTWHLDETLFATSTVLAAAPSATTGNVSAASFADENEYASATSSNDVYLSVTTGSAAAFPVVTKRVVHPVGDQTQTISVAWEGQSTNTATDVRLQVFKFGGADSGWYDLLTGTPPGANTDFTIASLVTNDTPVPGASLAAYYGKDPTGGLNDTATSVVMVRVLQGAAANETLRTDRLRVMFSPPAYAPKSQRWHWYDDENNETPSVSLSGAGEITPPVNVAYDNIFKLRLTIADSGGGGGTDIKFRLQFSEYSDFSQDVHFVSEQWNCTATSYWCYGNGVDADNAGIVSRNVSDANANGTHNETGTSTSVFDPGPGLATEFEFTLRHPGARANTVYFFRAYDATNEAAVPLNTGESYPSLSTEGSSLYFTITGLGSGVSTEGIVTDVAAGNAVINFGTLSSGAEVEAAQRLQVTTNATQGYQIFTFQRQGLSRSGGWEIVSVASTNESPASWAVPAGEAGAYGYHTGDPVLSGADPVRFAAYNRYAKFESNAKEVVYNSSPVIAETTDIVYKVQVTDTQPAGQYESAVAYIVVPVF